MLCDTKPPHITATFPTYSIRQLRKWKRDDDVTLLPVRIDGFNVCICFGIIYHIDAAMLSIVDLVVSDDRAAVRPDLDSCQGVTVDVVSFNETSAITKNINATLVAIENGIAPVFGHNST